MNRFSDLLVTDSSILLSARLTPISANGTPWCRLCINGSTLWEDFLDRSTSWSVVLPLLDPISIEIQLDRKIYCEHKETAIVIDSVTLDDFDLIPQWTGQARYENDHGVTSPTAYLGYNGVWTFHIPEPFYRWRHRILGLGWLLLPGD